jgi:hypothetical protein
MSPSASTRHGGADALNQPNTEMKSQMMS